MAEFYEEEPLRKLQESTPLVAGEIRRHAWSVKPLGREFELSYLSGELAGREKAVVIDEDDYRRLASQSVTIDEILRKYGVS
ncbi:MAG: hypothetical protein QM775_23530 [Pirellulales bacterium]